MKKISMIFLGLLTIILIAGCGTTEEKEQKLVCTSTENDDGMSIESVISMTYKNNKLNHMTMEVNTKVTDSDIQENWKIFESAMDEDNKEFNKDGISLKVESDAKNYEYKTTLDIDVENTTEEALKEQGFSDLKDDNSTIKSSKEAAEEDGYVCEIK